MIDFQGDKNLRRLIIGNIVVLVTAVLSLVWNFSAVVTVVDRNSQDIRGLEENVRTYVQVTDNRVSSLESQQDLLYDRLGALEELHLTPTPDGVEIATRTDPSRPGSLAWIRGLQGDQVSWPRRRSARPR